ncbi:hypothetical protein [Mycobacterium talmoniae]|uniref:PE domain-containing protein n=1 Tax=Mycobacterium talmoniae TaxID=1858794 RepID=A0A2S8BS33_9MYCO|nr:MULTISPECIES: hypothetical protein [Mycobacterium]PQM49490.1 hypothetical protein C1Y40_00287 [Mycobacterium talmoniae]TDH47550.1 hypothetical protein E2F47_26295 [Mycobacterium eburneum]
MSTVMHSSIESGVRAMNEALTSLSTHLTSVSAIPEKDLLAIIRRPGWTTPAEQALVEAMAAAITEHAQYLKRAHEALIEGALAVGQTA